LPIWDYSTNKFRVQFYLSGRTIVSFWQMFKAGFAFALGSFAFFWLLALTAGVLATAVA